MPIQNSRPLVELVVIVVQTLLFELSPLLPIGHGLLGLLILKALGAFDGNSRGKGIALSSGMRYKVPPSFKVDGNNPSLNVGVATCRACGIHCTCHPGSDSRQSRSGRRRLGLDGVVGIAQEHGAFKDI